MMHVACHRAGNRELEHLDPKIVGNARRVRLGRVVELENQRNQFEAAEVSFA